VFNRDIEFDFGFTYHVIEVRLDCRLVNASEDVQVAATVLVRTACFVSLQIDNLREHFAFTYLMWHVRVFRHWKSKSLAHPSGLRR